MQLVGVLGSVTPPGRLSRALEWTLEATRRLDAGIETRLVDLGKYRIAFADGRPLDQLGDDAERVVSELAGADAVLFASPVYRASITGALKNLLDLTPVDALVGKPCGIVAMGATEHHYLGVDWHLRDVLAWFGALTAPASVYLSSADFAGGSLSDSAQADLQALVSTLATLERALRGGNPLGPPPLAARRR